MEEQEIEKAEEQAQEQEVPQGTITIDDAIAQIVGSNDMLKASWDEMIAEEYGDSYQEERQDLIDIITVVDFIMEQYKSDDRSMLPAIFANMENVLVDPTNEAKELVVTGIIEGIQNNCNMDQLDYYTGFDEWLGERSKKYWDALIYVHESNDPAYLKEQRINTFLV